MYHMVESQFARIVLGIVLIGTLLMTRTSPLFAGALEDQRAQLEQELAQYEKEIADKEKILEQQRKQTGSFQRDVSILTNEIAQAKTKIKARTLAIQKISGEINQKANTIQTLQEKIDAQKESLGQLIRKTKEIDDENILHLVLSSEDISQFYGDVDSFATLKEAVKQSVDQIKTNKTQTEVQKKDLEAKQNQELDVKAQLEDAKHKVEVDKQAKDQLVKDSKGKEKQYETVLAEKRAKAASIRAALFSIRDTAAIPFGRALEYAQEAEKKTGIRPAFLLAILTQESNLGQNTGSCYLSDTATGSGTSSKSGKFVAKVMKPDRDVPIYLQITKNLGRDPLKTLISCPQAIGWGGAMGPSQFIPSTWNMYRPRLAADLGKLEPDPWNPEDAFMASALYLSDLGANAQTYTSERTAACRYYSGKACSALKAAANYGDSVMGKATNIQRNQIDPLKGF